MSIIPILNRWLFLFLIMVLLIVLHFLVRVGRVKRWIEDLMFLIHFPRVILLILLIVKLIFFFFFFFFHSCKLWVRAPLMSMISVLRMNCTAIAHMILISSSSNRWRCVVLFVSYLGRRSKDPCLMHSTAMRMLLVELRTVNLIRDMLTLKVGAFVFLCCVCSTQLSKDLVQICLHVLVTGFL